MRPQNNPSRAQAVTTIQLEAFRDELRAVIDVLQEAIKYTSETNGEIATHNFASGSDGLSRVRSFSNALAKSLLYSKLGKPLEVGEHKPRYTKKKPNPKDSDS